MGQPRQVNVSVGQGLVSSGAAKANYCYNGAGAAQLECPSHHSWVARLAIIQLRGTRLFDLSLPELNHTVVARPACCPQVLVCSDAMTRGMDVEGVQASRLLNVILSEPACRAGANGGLRA